MVRYGITLLIAITLISFGIESKVKNKKFSKKSARALVTNGNHSWRQLPSHQVINGFDIAILWHMLNVSGTNGGDSTLTGRQDKMAEMCTDVTQRLRLKYDTMPYMHDRIRTPFVMYRIARNYRPTDTIKGFQTFTNCSTYYDTANLANLVDTAYMDSITPYTWKSFITRFNNIFPYRNNPAYSDHSLRRCKFKDPNFLNERDVAVIRVVSRVSDSLGGFSFVRKYSIDEAGMFITYLGEKILTWTIDHDQTFTKKQRYVKSMWEVSKYANQITGEYLRGFETKSICDSMYNIYLDGDPLTWALMKLEHRPYTEYVRKYLSLFAGEPL